MIWWERLKANAEALLGIVVAFLGIAAVIWYSATDAMVGWWGLVFIAPILVVLGLAVGAHR